jgi:hypothetical protein
MIMMSETRHDLLSESRPPPPRLGPGPGRCCHGPPCSFSVLVTATAMMVTVSKMIIFTDSHPLHKASGRARAPSRWPGPRPRGPWRRQARALSLPESVAFPHRLLANAGATLARSCKRAAADTQPLPTRSRGPVDRRLVAIVEDFASGHRQGPENVTGVTRVGRGAANGPGSAQFPADPR